MSDFIALVEQQFLAYDPQFFFKIFTVQFYVYLINTNNKKRCKK